MNNNDILRRIRYIFNYNNANMVTIFAAADYKVNRGQVISWLEDKDKPGFKLCDDKDMSAFLNGWINDRRGKKDGEAPRPEAELTKNIIFRKLIIALDLKSEETLVLLERGNTILSKHELSALFRKADHKHYRKCTDQVLQSFFKGAQTKYHTKK